MSFYQPTLDSLELKNDKVIDYVFSSKSDGVKNSKSKQIYILLSCIKALKCSGYRREVKFDKDTLLVLNQNCKWLHCQ